jgi:prepilin-type N-terminal cleavage/methylation domain-containing protein
MIHLKNNKFGFTLIEVLFSTAIVGVVLIPIYALQGQAMGRIVKAANSVQRMLTGFNFFLEAHDAFDEKEKKIEKKSDDPYMQMSFKVEDLSGKSTLGKAFNNLKIEKASWEWQLEGKKQIDELVSIVFNPPEPEPEKEEKNEAQKPKEAASGDAQKGAVASQTGAQKAPAGGKK